MQGGDFTNDNGRRRFNTRHVDGIRQRGECSAHHLLLIRATPLNGGGGRFGGATRP